MASSVVMPLNTVSYCLGRGREGGVPAADVFMGMRSPVGLLSSPCCSASSAMPHSGGHRKSEVKTKIARSSELGARSTARYGMV